MTAPTTDPKNSGITGWIDARLPIFTFINKELRNYPTPRNLNYLWNFGSLAGITLVIMIISGIFLAMHYTPHVDHAFNSVEHIMREVNYGWMIRYIHMNGASFFFIVVYIHIFRGMYYGSFKAPRELLWILGVFIYLIMMATAFMGYVLPWGQMSYWGATVITNLFSAIPFVGDGIVTWLWGGFSVDNPTLNRFFALHYLLPFVIVAVVVLHLVALHQFGSNNPVGIERKKPEESIPFHPYYTVKDFFGLGVFLCIWGFFVFFAPNFFGEPDNYIPANALVTPPHIVPEWYFLPFYAILRSVPDKLGGVVLMFSAVLVLFVLPWLDKHPVRSGRYRPLFRVLFLGLIISCGALAWAGAQMPEGIPLWIGRIAAVYYFSYFFLILPLLSRYEKPSPIPDSLSAAESGRRKTERGKINAVFLLIAAFFGHSFAYSNEHIIFPRENWSFEKPGGTFNRADLQRGFQVFEEVCAACHGLEQISFLKLKALGYKENEIKAIAAKKEVTDGFDADGNPAKRPARPSDLIHSPFANAAAARAANNGIVPPDLSLMVKARKGGADYIHALLTGYVPPPADVTMAPGMNYNPYFPGGQIAMPAPLSADVVTYTDGTAATVDQMSRDVATFLAWAAEPEQEERRRMGIRVLLYLGIFSIFMFFTMRRVWRRLDHPQKK